MNPTAVIWAGLSVADLASQIAFYRDVVGLRLLRQGDDWAHFAISPGSLFELFAGGVASASPKDAGQQSLVIGLRVDDLDAAVAELQGKGVNFLGEIGSFRNQRWTYFVDPEGNRLEIKEIK
jgi:predicted enzyme related to lactoylglutathione lyase